jgi:hypothetical protein
MSDDVISIDEMILKAIPKNKWCKVEMWVKQLEDGESLLIDGLQMVAE